MLKDHADSVGKHDSYYQKYKVDPIHTEDEFSEHEEGKSRKERKRRHRKYHLRAQSPRNS